MNYKQALDRGILLLENEGIEDAKIDAWYLLSYVSGMKKAENIIGR